MRLRFYALLILVVSVLTVWGGLAFGQGLDGRREQVTRAPEYRGTRANAPVPPEMHTANKNAITRDPMWGGCVPSSTRTAALFAGVPRALIDAYWDLAQRTVGRAGTGPDLQADMLQRTMPHEPWTQYIGPEPLRALAEMSSKGYAMCSTMSWGDMYQGMIHHWVTPIHFDPAADLACFIDNNDPGQYHWTTAREFAARAVDNGIAWVFAFTRAHPAATATLAIAAAILLLASATAVVLALVGCFTLVVSLRFGRL
jgi:hypothetical protein